jgi:hypothetical protein
MCDGRTQVSKGQDLLPQQSHGNLKLHVDSFAGCPVGHHGEIHHHESRPVTLSMTVDGKQHADPWLQRLQELYTVTADWDGTKHFGLTLYWEYTNHTFHLSMTG